MEQLDIKPYGVEGYKINGERYTKIRSMVMGIVILKDKILLTEHFEKDYPFYRCIGGGIEFFEKSMDAIKREFKEETGLDVIVEKYLGIAEALFIHKGKRGHEIIQLYKVDLNTDNVQDEYPILDSDVTAKWIDIADIISGKKVVYPDEVADYIKQLMINNN